MLLKYISKPRSKELAVFAERKWRADVFRGRRNRVREKHALIQHHIIPPAIFSFSENYLETVTCLQRLKDSVLIEASRDRRIRTYLDFKPIKRITIAGALVLAAEIDRWKRIKRVNLQPKDTHLWDPSVKRILSELGFFDLLGVNSPEITNDGYDQGQITVIPFISSASVNGELFNKVFEHLVSVAEFFKQDPSIYSALIEASYNTTLHAYPTGYNFKYPIVGKRWWATCSFDPSSECIKFLVYDQGVGIPETLPRWKYWENVRAKLTSIPILGDRIGAAINDSSRAIEAAIDVSRTSLDGGHGQGLKDIVTPIELVEGAAVRVLSGKGSVLYTKGGIVKLRDEALHIGGTLIEWAIPARSLPHEVEST